MINVIIPVLNEEVVLTEKADYYQKLKTKARIIFVDGGSTDRTGQVAKNYGEVILSGRGRALQKNSGAANTQTEYLLFLHVDSYLCDDSMDAIVRALDNGVAGGCLTMKIEDGHWMFRLYETIINFRAKYFRVLDGDLGLFVKRSVFNDLGQFDSVNIMEDIMFAKKLRRAGRVQVLPQCICVSSRKWHDNGFGKTFFAYSLAYLRYWTRIPSFKQ